MSLLEKLELFRKRGEYLKSINQEINFNKCEIKTIKGELRNIKNKINNGIYTNIKSKVIGTTEVIERIKIENKPEQTKHEINMTEVVNEFKTIDLKTYLTKVPEDILINYQKPKTNPNSYYEFKLKKSAEV